MKTEQPALPIPDIGAFCTRAAAAARLGTTEQTVGRWVKRGKLKTYAPRHTARERVPILLSCAEVDAYARARRIVKGDA